MNPNVEAKLRQLVEFAEANNLEEISWAGENMHIAFRRGAKTIEDHLVEEIMDVPVPVPVPEAIVKSPMVGTFRRSSTKDRPPLAVDGDHVKPGDRLGIVECMKIPTEVVSFCEGHIKKILVEDGEPVEYGQPLFSILAAHTLETNGKN